MCWCTSPSRTAPGVSGAARKLRALLQPLRKVCWRFWLRQLCFGDSELGRRGGGIWCILYACHLRLSIYLLVSLFIVSVFKLLLIHPSIHLSIHPSVHFWAMWKDRFLHIIDKHASRRTIKVRNKSSPWITQEIKHKMHLRDQLKRTAIKTKNPEDWINYKRQKNLVNKEVKRVKKTFYRNEIEWNRGDFKGTWRVLNSLMNRKSNSTMINEIKISSSESLTKSKRYC